MKKIITLFLICFALSCGKYIDQKIEDAAQPDINIITIHSNEECELCPPKIIDAVYAHAMTNVNGWVLAVQFTDGCIKTDDLIYFGAYMRYAEDGAYRRNIWSVLNLKEATFDCDVTLFGGVETNIYMILPHLCQEAWCGENTIVEIILEDNNHIQQQIFVNPRAKLSL